MMKPKFKILPTERLYIGLKWVSNSHWILSREWALHLNDGIGKEFQKIQGLRLGSYPDGYRNAGSWKDSTPDLQRPFERLSNELKPIQSLDAVWMKNGLVYGEMFRIESTILSLDVGYASLLRQRSVKGKADTESSPVALYEFDELIGLIMPLREGGPEWVKEVLWL